MYVRVKNWKAALSLAEVVRVYSCDIYFTVTTGLRLYGIVETRIFRVLLPKYIFLAKTTLIRRDIFKNSSSQEGGGGLMMKSITWKIIKKCRNASLMECVSCLQRTANTVKKIPSDILKGDMTQTKQCISCNREVSSSDFFTTQFILPALAYLTSVSPISHHITLKFPSPRLTSLHVTYLTRVTYA